MTTALVPHIPDLTQAAFLAGLVERFPSIAEEVLEDAGLIHLQVSSLARYANHCLSTGQLEELARILTYFYQTVERVDSNTENALYVSFLEHLDFEGETENAKRARQLLQPPYKAIWKGLREQ